MHRRGCHGLRNTPGRNTDCGRITLDIFEDNRVSPYLYVVSKRDVTQNACACANKTPVTQCRMSLSSFLACTAESYVLVDGAVIPDNGSFPDDHPHSVVDEQSVPNGSPGVNLDSGQKPRYLGYRSGNHGNVIRPQEVSDAVEQHCPQAWVQQHLEPAGNGRVVFDNNSRDLDEVFYQLHWSGGNLETCQMDILFTLVDTLRVLYLHYPDRSLSIGI